MNISVLISEDRESVFVLAPKDDVVIVESAASMILVLYLVGCKEVLLTKLAEEENFVFSDVVEIS